MSLVILNDDIADHLSGEIVQALIYELRKNLANLQDGKDTYKRVNDLCTEIASVARQIQQFNKEDKTPEVKF